MTYIPKKPCAHYGCKNYATQGQYCDEHKCNIQRGTTSKFVSFYKTTRWKTARQHFLTIHIWCEECLKNNRHTLADTVHHAHGFCDYNSFFDSHYWIALCASCHSKIHTQVTNEELWNKWQE